LVFYGQQLFKPVPFSENFFIPKKFIVGTNGYKVRIADTVNDYAPAGCLTQTFIENVFGFERHGYYTLALQKRLKNLLDIMLLFATHPSKIVNPP
jgi:hypothetical protein